MVDFAQLKKDVPIENVIGFLGLTMKPDGAQLRSPCPACEKGGDRALVVTPAKGVFYCFAAKTGGDLLALVSHINKVTIKEAGQFIAGKITAPDSPTVPENKKGHDSDGEFKPLTYLEHDHELVTAVGFPDEVCKAVGIGYAPKGLMRGHIAIPIRLPDGHLVGYVGVEQAKLPPTWRLT